MGYKNKILTVLVMACMTLSSLYAQNKPNIVVIMADDIGLGDIGFYHKQRTGKTPLVPTPNIDKLIDQGIRFSDAHSPSSLCAPTRFSMLTGNFIYRNNERPWGVWRPFDDTGIEPKFTTTARIAKKGGYNTAFFGKWGLGGDWDGWPKDDSGYEETDKGANYYGFDYSVSLPQGIQNIPYAFYENGKFMKIKSDSKITKIPFEQLKYADEKKRKKGGSIGDSNWDPALAGPILVDKAVNYIDAQTKSKQPFYLYYCSQAVHVPHNPTASLNGKKVAGSTLGTHGDMIVELDIQVGMLIKALKDAGKYKNTLFVFTSDNGGLNANKALKNAGHDSSNGFRAKKASIHEGGHRIPFIAVWPGKIEPKTESDVTIVAHDLVQTIASVVDVSVDKEKTLDSANLLPVLTEGVNKSLHKYLMHASQAKSGPYYALRQGDWKLILKGESMKDLGVLTPIELYNLKDNPQENPTKNKIKDPEFAERIEDMKATYFQLRANGKSTLF